MGETVEVPPLHVGGVEAPRADFCRGGKVCGKRPGVKVSSGESCGLLQREKKESRMTTKFPSKKKKTQKNKNKPKKKKKTQKKKKTPNPTHPTIKRKRGA